MKLIVDSGGSKTEWCLIDGNNVLTRFQVPGMHALMLTGEELTRRIADEVIPQLLPWIDATGRGRPSPQSVDAPGSPEITPSGSTGRGRPSPQSVDAPPSPEITPSGSTGRGRPSSQSVDAPGSPEITNVYFYGAGCVSPQVCGMVRDAIRANLPDAEVEVASDLLGTARALCGDKPGIPCILGTGSNSCYYDGERIVDNVSPLGFILGDEGGGAYLGKMLVGDVLKRQLPEHICRKFLEEYDLDNIKVVQHVYRESAPNRWLASLTPFLSANIGEPAIHDLVVRAFQAFFKRNVCHYKEGGKTVSFVGSIAHFFLPQLTEAAESFGYTVGTVKRTPMDGLIEYHGTSI